MLLLLWTLLVQGMWLWFLTAVCSMDGGEVDDWVPSAATVCGVLFCWGASSGWCAVLCTSAVLVRGLKGMHACVSLEKEYRLVPISI